MDHNAELSVLMTSNKIIVILTWQNILVSCFKTIWYIIYNYLVSFSITVCVELTFLAVQVLALSVDLSGEAQDVENTLDQVREHPKNLFEKNKWKKQASLWPPTITISTIIAQKTRKLCFNLCSAYLVCMLLQ